MTKTVPLAAMILVALLAGCSKKDEPAVARHDSNVPQPVSVPTPTPAPAVAFEPVEGVVFEITPLQFRRCEADKGRIVANVKWDVTAASVKFINVLVANGNAEPTLFVTGKASGERSTGNWVADGTQFILQDAANKKKLAEFTVSGVDC